MATKKQPKKQIQQLKLVPDTIERGVFRIVQVADLPKDLPGDPPDQAFLNSVRDFGIIQPIILTEGSQGVKVAAGRNRIKAARLIGIAELGAVVFQEGWVSTESLTLIENRHRRQNPLADMLAIEALLKAGNDEAKIAAQLSISAATIKARLRLRNLVPEIGQALRDGKLFVGVAEQIAKMSQAQQKELLPNLVKNDKLTAADVTAVQSATAATVTASLPEEVFGDPAAQAPTPAPAAPPPPAARTDEQITADLAGRGWKIKPGKGGMIEATHKLIGFTAAPDYPTLEVNVERAERQWEAYSGFKAWQADQQRRKLMDWSDLAAELVQQLSDLVPTERVEVVAAVEGLATLLSIPANVAPVHTNGVEAEAQL